MVGVSGRKIVVSSLTLQVGGSITIRYGAQLDGPGASASEERGRSADLGRVLAGG